MNVHLIHTFAHTFPSKAHEKAGTALFQDSPCKPAPMPNQGNFLSENSSNLPHCRFLPATNGTSARLPYRTSRKSFSCDIDRRNCAQSRRARRRIGRQNRLKISGAHSLSLPFSYTRAGSFCDPALWYVLLTFRSTASADFLWSC